MAKSKYFHPQELVSKAVYNGYSDKEAIYDIFDPLALEILDLIRGWAGIPLTVNNWQAGGTRQQCGYRGNDCKIGAPKSAHKSGKAFDVISSKKTAQELWATIDANKDKLPCKIRIEKTSNGKNISWLHFDTAVKPEQNDQVYYFNA